MKKNNLIMLFKTSIFMLALMFVFSACKKDDDDDNGTPPVLLEDGIYIKGATTPYTDFEVDALLDAGINEVGQAERADMYEKYTTLKAGTFEIIEVAGTTQTVWGPATNTLVTLAGENDQIRAKVQKGTLGNSGTFSVPSDGMYHIIIDKETNNYIITPVNWGIIGAFSGWSHVDMPLVGGFNQEEMTWRVEGLELYAGAFKFRHDSGWKVELDPLLVKANTNFGGVVSGTLPNLTTTLIPGGPDYAITEAQQGIYTATLKWTAADGYTSTMVKTDDVEPITYPETLFMIGASVGGWDWATIDLPMYPVNSQPHLFWKIVWIQALDTDDKGFKFAPTKAWGSDFGKTGDMSADSIWAKGGDNITVTTTGYYMVTVNFETEEIAVTKPQVYLIGDAVGSWDQTAAANLFTVDNTNQVITKTKDLVAANIRMYAWMDKGEWFSAWWQSEFNIIDGVIQYRGTGGDQTPVPVAAGPTTITLNFKNNTGTIAPAGK